MAKILTPDTVTNSLKFNWQLAFALGFTDNWQRTWLSLIFYKTRFKALNSIVLLFSSDYVIKCAFWGVILAARPLSVIFRWWFTIKPMSCTICGKNDLWSHASIRWLLMRALQKAIASFFQVDSDTVFLSIYVPIIYSEGINFDSHNCWKCWTLGQQKRSSGGE